MKTDRSCWFSDYGEDGLLCETHGLAEAAACGTELRRLQEVERLAAHLVECSEHSKDCGCGSSEADFDDTYEKLKVATLQRREEDNDA